MKDNSAAHSLFSPSSIRSRVQQDQKDNETAANAEEEGADAALPDKIDPLPRPGDTYKVHGRRGNKPDLTIHFVTKDFSYEGFSYGDFERVRLVASEKPGSAPLLMVRFSGSVITEVTIEGRHLHSLYNWIGLHRVPWVWEHPSPAQFIDEKATLISRITFRQVER
jgi:hypothetical protein